MKISENLPKILVGVFLIGGISMIVWNSVATTAQTQPVDVRIPTLSAPAQKGKLVYDANCAACHGANGAGSEQGPPLVHDIYNPGHHADESFIRAVRLGVPRHHWNFGNMMPQPKVSFEETTDIIKYIRELQRANGIFYKPHRM
ncbi:MAG: cytochrome c [Rhodospirillales bacterium]|nr:cytochrome c [Rhodospirillales bacterium]